MRVRVNVNAPGSLRLQRGRGSYAPSKTRIYYGITVYWPAISAFPYDRDVCAALRGMHAPSALQHYYQHRAILRLPTHHRALPWRSP